MDAGATTLTGASTVADAGAGEGDGGATAGNDVTDEVDSMVGVRNTDGNGRASGPDYHNQTQHHLRKQRIKAVHTGGRIIVYQ